MSFKDLLTNYLNKSGVISEGDLSKYTSPSLLAPDVKLIMPDKCDLCTIGIGKSMQFHDGVWTEITHMHDKFYEMKIGGKEYKMCEWCYEDMKKRENKAGYLYKFKKTKKR